MIKQLSIITKRFYSYQKDRFPIIVLMLSLFPAVLSSGVVATSHPSIFKALMALIASIAYLLHIRVIDEHRDFDHDTEHHTDRPIQTGLISEKELHGINMVAIIVLLVIAIVSGGWALLLAFIMLGYSYLAGKEFFLGEKIRQYFFFYNSVNLVQMLLMQFFVYLIFTNNLSWGRLLLVHFLFTTVGTILFEFVRKLKVPGNDGTGKDTYTWYLGFGNSIIIYIILFLINIFLFFKIVSLISTSPLIWLIFTTFLSTIITLLAIFHWIKRKQFTDYLLQLSFLISYGVLNLIIYFIKIY